MGRGDKKTAKGKRFKGSFGNSRPSKVKAAVAAPKVKSEAKAPKKAAAKKAAEPKAVTAKKAPAKKKAEAKGEE